MQYIFSCPNPHRHFIDIECVITDVKANTLTVQLPAWRPGRYELGNFAKNIQKWEAFDASNKKLKAKKITKDSWEITTKDISEVHIKYNYYASELNAGSSYLDEKQLYVNPVNCCLFVPERINESCQVELMLPKDYMVATGMKAVGENKFVTKDFHELADSPFIASNTLKHNEVVVSGVKFHLWFQGECTPDWTKLLNDFYIFIKEQMAAMKEFPAKEYHFLFQILPFRFYHGVEHVTSTVIALGPTYSLMENNLYDELLGISSHELYHSWNIKTIRPVEMMPYDYTKENYSRLGYVCEGVTTYYGDYFLFRSGVFNEQEYFKTFNERLQKHFHNPARFTMPVTDASFDTWLDGYVSGIPWRKTSIYDEGCLLAFFTDMLIRRKTKNKKSLDDVMLNLYNEFAKKGKGYSEDDYMTVVEQVGGDSFTEFFMNYVYGSKDFEPVLQEQLAYVGCELIKTRSKKHHEAYFGFKLQEGIVPPKIALVYPDSVADRAGLSMNDELIAINQHPVKNDLNEWEKYFSGGQVEMIVVSNGYTKTVKLSPSSGEHYLNYSVTKIKNPTDEQKEAYGLWAKRKF
jgi:predicted metalloprotease with PDZ domain